MRATPALLLALAILAIADVASGSTGCAVVHEGDDISIRVRWAKSGPATLRFTIEADGVPDDLSALAFGVAHEKGFFSASASDTFIALPGEGEDGTVADAHFRKMKVRRDAHSDVAHSSAAKVSGGFLVAEFERDLITSDAEEDVKILLDGTTQKLFWAYWRGVDGHQGRPAGMALEGQADFSKFDDQCRRTLSASKAVVTGTTAAASTAVQSSKCSFANDNETFSLMWRIEGDMIAFEMLAATTGWAGIGIGDSCSMTNADMYVGWVNDSTLLPTLQDDWSLGHARPKLDTSFANGTSDVTDISGWQNATHTLLRWRRPLVTIDDYDFDIANESVTVMWAIGLSETGPAGYPKHKSYGCKKINFLDTCAPEPDTTPDCSYTANENYTLKWYVKSSDKNVIVFEATALTTGWLGLGLGSSCTMKNVDMYVGWVNDSTGIPVLQDDWSTGHTRPKLDTSLNGTSDVSGVYGWQNATHTFIRWERSLNTGDSLDAVVNSSDITVIWAVGLTESGATGYPKHKYYGCSTINLLQCALPEPVVPVCSLSSGGNFSVRWYLKGDKKEIMAFEATALTTGWVGLGFGSSCAMKNADMYVGWVNDSTLSPVVLDDWSTGHTRPKLDTSLNGTDDIFGVTGWQNDTHTFLAWERLLYTGDIYDMNIVDKTITLMWALAKSETGPSGYPKHSMYGCSDINLLQCADAQPTTPVCSSASNGNFSLQWYFSGDSKDNIVFEATALTTGWLGIGIGSSCSMKNIDMYVGWVNDTTGIPVVLDDWSVGHSRPKLDTSLNGTDDVTAIRGWQNATHTFLRWERKVNTGDTYDAVIEDASVTLLWAVGTTESGPSGYPKHKFWGCQEINFVQCEATESSAVTESSGDAIESSVPVPVQSSDAAECDAASIDGSYSTDAFSLQWKAALGGKALDFVMTGKTAGWVSFGINTLYSMTSSDMYTGWVKNGTVTVIDSYSSGHSLPDTDVALGGTDDATNKEGSENETHTVIKFRRLLDTGDSHDAAIVNKAIWVIWALGKSDGSDDFSYEEHYAEGGSQINFFICGGTVVPVDNSIFLGNAGQGMGLTVAAFIVVLAICTLGSKLTSSSSSSANGEYTKLNDSPSQSVLITKISGFFGMRLFEMSSLGSTLLGVLYIVASLVWAVAWVCAWPTNENSLDKEKIPRVLGQLTACNMVVCVLLATRNSLLWLLAGQPFDRVLPFHRWAGAWTLLVLLGHGIGFVITRGKEVVVVNGEIQNNLVFGIVGGFCCILMATAAIEKFRRKHYNFFRVTHFLFVPFFLFSALHMPHTVVPFVIVAAVLYGVDRIMRIIRSTPQKVAEVRPLPGNTLRIRWPKGCNSLHEPGQYAFLRFPGVSLLDDHPFSMSAAANSPMCEVNVRSLGDFTGKLQKVIPQLQKAGPVTVCADGPYGSLAIDMKQYNTIVLVANGIGITPIIGIIRSIYGVDGTAPFPVGRVQRVVLHWGVRDLDMYSWFSSHIDKAKEAIAAANGALPQLNLQIYVFDRPTTPAPAMPQIGDTAGMFSSGMMNPKQIVEETMYQAKGPVGLIACGVPPVVQQLWDSCAAQRRQGRHIDFHYESFLF